LAADILGLGAQRLPAWALVAIGVLIVVQITLDVIALVDLYRRPVAQVTLGNKWVWVPIVLFVGVIGAILYLVGGRRPTPAVDARPARPASDRVAAAVNALYGRGGPGGAAGPGGPPP
jgi:hypothetical protein